MPEKERDPVKGQISRRQFIKGAGIVIGGTAVGSTFLLSACGGGGATTTATRTTTVTSTVPTTVTETTAAATITETVGPTVTKFICPFDNTEFDTLEELKAYCEQFLAGATINTLTVNGQLYGFSDLKPYESLQHVLRERLGIFSPKNGCNQAECGACTVLLDGKPVNSCILLAAEYDGATVETVENLSEGTVLNPVQQKIYDADALQCGYCTPGVVMAATALFRQNANPTLAEVQQALAGNICTCGNMNVYLATLANIQREANLYAA